MVLYNLTRLQLALKTPRDLGRKALLGTKMFSCQFGIRYRNCLRQLFELAIALAISLR